MNATVIFSLKRIWKFQPCLWFLGLNFVINTCHIRDLMGYRKLGTTKSNGIFVSSENLLKPISCHFQANVYVQHFQNLLNSSSDSLPNMRFLLEQKSYLLLCTLAFLLDLLWCNAITNELNFKFMEITRLQIIFWHRI